MNSFKSLIVMDLERIYDSKTIEMPKKSLKIILVVLRYFFTSKSFRSILLYRILKSDFFNNKENLRNIFIVIRKLLLCVEIPYTVEIGGGFTLGYAEGIILNYKCNIGDYVTIQHGVTLGGNMGKIKDGREAPFIGNNVFIGPGAKVLGPVIIGDNSIIGANAVVVKDIPKNSIAVGIPAKVIKKVDKNFLEIQKEWKKHLINQSKEHID